MSLLILHGLYGNEPEHWQTWLATEAPTLGFDVHYPEFPAPDTPNLDTWLTTLDSVLSNLIPDALMVVAHSLGCHLWMHRLARVPETKAARVLLVAPPQPQTLVEVSPELPGVQLDADPLRAACADTAVVLGEYDPYRPTADFIDPALPVYWVAGGGHLSVAAGFGPWPAVLAWSLGGPPPGELR